MIEVILKAIEEAKKHHIHRYVIACSIEDYPEVKAICKDKFPQIRVVYTDAIEKGKIYLWDDIFNNVKTPINNLAFTKQDGTPVLFAKEAAVTGSITDEF